MVLLQQEPRKRKRRKRKAEKGVKSRSAQQASGKSSIFRCADVAQILSVIKQQRVPNQLERTEPVVGASVRYLNVLLICVSLKTPEIE